MLVRDYVHKHAIFIYLYCVRKTNSADTAKMCSGICAEPATIICIFVLVVLVQLLTTCRDGNGCIYGQIFSNERIYWANF